MKQGLLGLLLLLACASLPLTVSGQTWPNHLVFDFFENPRNLLTADIDGDGDLDISGAAYWDTLRWYENVDGSGVLWQPHVMDTTLVYPHHACAGDFDGDGDMDIAATFLGDDGVWWWENVTGDGLQWTTHPIATIDLGVAREIEAADIDGDGDLDFAADNDHDAVWFRNLNGDGLDWEMNTITVDQSISDNLYLFDLDGDGDTDLVSRQSSTSINWWENLHGNGSGWVLHDVASTTYYVSEIKIADFDSDGDFDVAAASSVELGWYENADGTGLNFISHEIDMHYPAIEEIEAADFDGDGDMDIAAANELWDRLAWWENEDGSGLEWTIHITGEVYAKAKTMCSGDIDGDGDVDVVQASYDTDDIRWWENSGDGVNTFGTFPIEQNRLLRTVAAADFDGDGDMDLVGADNPADELCWWENLGQGLLWTEHELATGFDRPEHIFAVDMDSDGDADVLCRRYDWSQTDWWENDGTGQNWNHHPMGTGVTGADEVCPADIDGDGDIDLFGMYTYETTMVWIENGGANGWTEHDLTTTYDYPRAIFPADIDADGDTDLVSGTGGAGEATVDWWENVNGDGSQWLRHEITTTHQTIDVTSADMDGDGDLDIAVSSSDLLPQGNGPVIWLENLDGAGSAWDIHLVDWESDARAILAADLDFDGDQDLYSYEYRSWDDLATLVWWENLDGAGRYWDQQQICSQYSGFPSFGAADMNGDGYPDIYSSFRYEDAAYWWKMPGTDDVLTFSLQPTSETDLPEEGGIIYFNGILASSLPVTDPNAQLWTRIRRPNGVFYPGLQTNFSFTLIPFMNETFSLSQYIPDTTPAGLYQLYGWVGLDPNFGPNFGSSFWFRKTLGTGVAESTGNSSLPRDFDLAPAYPNPFNATTTITVALPHPADVRVAVFDVLGREVMRLVDGPAAAGVHECILRDGELASGVYFVRATVPGKLNATQKVVLLK